MLDLFTNATISASVLKSFDENIPFTGNAALGKKEKSKSSTPQANSTETVGTRTRCAGCETLMPVRINFKTREVYEFCITCFKKKTQEKKDKAAADAKAKAAGAAKKVSTPKPAVSTRAIANSADSSATAVTSSEFIENYSEDEESL